MAKNSEIQTFADVSKSTPVTTVSRRKRPPQESGPRYECIKDSFIDNAFLPTGSEVVYLGMPGSNLKPLNDEAKARKERVKFLRTDKSLSDKYDRDEEGKRLGFSERELALKQQSDEWNGVVAEDEWTESET
jgi:hypothetical protein